MRDFDKPPKKTSHPYAWLWDPLEDEPTFILKSMFGAKAAYLDGKLQLLFMAKQEPWRGVFVATDRQHQESLIKEFPALSPHAVISKWLCLQETADDFETVAQRLVILVRQRDARIGVEGSPKKTRVRKSKHG